MSNATLTINDNATLIIGGQGNYDRTDTNASQATLVLNGPLNISAKVDEGQTPHKYTLEMASGNASNFSPERAVNGSELSSHTAVPWGTIGKWAIITGGMAGAVAGAAAAYVYRRKMQNFITKTVIGALSSWLPTASTMATVTYVVVPLAIIGGMYLLVRKVCNEKKPELDNEPKAVTREIAIDKKPQGSDDQKKTPKKSTEPSEIDSKINSDFRQRVVNANANVQRGVITKRRGSCIPGQTNLPNINNHESQINQSLSKKDDGNKIKNNVQTKSVPLRPEASENDKEDLKDRKNDLNNRENRFRFETSPSTSTTDSEDSYSDEGAAESIAYRVKKFHAEQEGKKVNLGEESTPKKTMTRNQTTRDESGAALHTFPSVTEANSKPVTGVLPNTSISLPITPVYVQKSGTAITPSSREGSNIKPITQSINTSINELNGMQFAIFADEKSSKEKLQQAAGEAQKALEKFSGSSLDQKEVSMVMLSPKTENADTDKAVEKSPSSAETKQNVEAPTPRRSPRIRNQHK